MSIAAQQFLEKNNILLEKGKHRLYEVKDINIILDEFRVTSDLIREKQICIKDILGFDYSWRRETNDLYQTFNSYFNSEGDSYHSRANGMLEYSSSDIAEKLSASFRVEPIKVVEVEEGKYVVDENGIHRFNILKVSYLGEIAKCTSQEEVEEVNEKFTIPVKVRKIDIFKSYCNYLLNTFKKDSSAFYWIRSLDESELCSVSYGGTKVTLTNEELLAFVIENVKSEMIEGNWYIEMLADNYDSFKNFIGNYYTMKNERKII